MMKILGWSWSLGRLRGVDIRFHFSMLFSLPIAVYLFKPVDVRGLAEAALWVGGFLAFILLHELGHTFAAQSVGVEVKSVVVWLLGGFTNFSYKPERPLHNLFIAFAGPLVNMLLAFLCVAAYIAMAVLFLPYSNTPAVYLWAQTLQNLAFSLAVVNLILVVFNLLPVYPLDGGNILHATMELFFGKVNADRITLWVSIPFLLLLVGFGLAIRDYILLAFCVLIALAIGTLNRSILRRINLGINFVFRRSAYSLMLGDYDLAVKTYTRDIEKQPEQVIHYLGRASCYLLMNQKERALADVERALKINPKQAFALELRGEIHALEKNYEAALDHFARAQSINPHWAVPYFDRASVHVERGEYWEAVELFNKAISLQSRQPLFYVVRSLAHFRLGNLNAAHADQDMAVDLSPNEALVMVEVNLMLYEKNLDWARDYYDRILTKTPHKALALQGCADACLANQDFIRAVDFYTRAMEFSPKEPRLYLGRGKARMGLNEFENAKADLEKIAMLTEKAHLKRQADDLLKAAG